MKPRKYSLEMSYEAHTPGLRQIGDFARAKDTLSVIIVDIDTMIYKTYPEFGSNYCNPIIRKIL